MPIFNGISKKMTALLVSVIILTAIAVGGTVALIISKTDSLDNKFDPARVSCEITETFDGSTKSDVAVKNTGDTDAFIRAIIIVNWVSETDSSTVLSQVPVMGTDYTVEFGASDWVKGADGFWYHKKAIAPNASTSNLINSCKAVSDAPDGYKLSVRVLASAIQSSPASVVEEAWGVTNDLGTIAP